MDIEGARILSDRIAQQRHWAEADAVLDGRNPAVDPDAHRLTEMHAGLRVYDTEVLPTIIEGRPARLTRVFCKELVDGAWRSFVEERVTVDD
jgi:hypothetical protein